MEYQLTARPQQPEARNQLPDLNRRRPPAGLVVVIAAFILLGLLYDLTTPFFEKPDELKHFAVIQFIQTEGRLPVVREGVYKPWDQEGTQPPLYHMLAALAVAWLDLSDFEEPPRNPHYADDRSFVWRERGNNNLYLHPPGETWRAEPVLLAARLARQLSLAAGVGTILLTYSLAQVILVNGKSVQAGKSKKQRFTNPVSAERDAGRFNRGGQSGPRSRPLSGRVRPILTARNRLAPLLAAACVAFIPQFLHVSAAITNDSLSVTIAAAALLILALVLKHGGSARYAVYLGLILGLGAMTKLSLLYLMPLTGLVFLVDWARHRSTGRFIRYGLIIAGLAGLLSGWWYGRNWLLYGDVTALNAHLLYRGGALDPRPSLAQIWQTELVGLELSFWAAFGAGQILLEPWLYAILRGLKYVVLLGLIIGFWRLIRRRIAAGNRPTNQPPPVAASPLAPSSPATPSAIPDSPTARRPTPATPSTFQLQALILLLLWTLTIFLALLRWMQITPASWGRLLYPALPTLGVLTAWALFELSRLLSYFTLYGLRVRPSLPRPSMLRRTLRLTRRYVGVRKIRRTRPTRRRRRRVIAASLPTFLPCLLPAGLFILSLLSPFRYIQAAYAKTPLISEAALPEEEIERLDYTYANALRLIGYRLEKDSIRAGEWLPVTLYWQATRPLTRNYTTFVHVLDSAGRSLAQANTYPDGGKWPTSLLEPGRILKDTVHVFIPPEREQDAPLATRLAIGLFEFDDPDRTAKTAFNAAGDVVESIVPGPPLLPRQWPVLEPDHPRRATFAGQIRLIGYDWVNEPVAPGEERLLTFYWETLAAPDRNLNLFIHLVDPAAQTQVAGFDGPPPLPTTFWQAGNTFIDTRRLPFPADLAPGDYRLQIGWYDLETFTRLETASGDSLPLLTVSVRP